MPSRTTAAEQLTDDVLKPRGDGQDLHGTSGVGAVRQPSSVRRSFPGRMDFDRVYHLLFSQDFSFALK